MIDLARLNEQQRRVLLAARKQPIRQQDFDLPNVIDGGKPIKRVAARVGELKHQFGCEWSKAMVPASGAPDAALVAEYTLLSEPSTDCPSPSLRGQQPAAAPAAAGTLFAFPQCAINDDWDADAA